MPSNSFAARRPRKVTPVIQELVDRFENAAVEEPQPVAMNDPRFLNPQIINMDRMFPRVAVTPAILSTYALMRGPFEIRGDPVHWALFPHPDRRSGFNPIFVPHLQIPEPPGYPIEELPRGSVVFWDPLVPKPPFAPAARAAVLNPNAKIDTRAYSFLDHMALRLSTGGNNHHKGDRVYENFGYVRDQTTKSWIDPDATGLLKDEYNICRFKRAKDGVDGCHIPDFRRSQRSGPRAMSGEEQDAFYQWYLSYVQDEGDAEGDPRARRITPAIFARWAEGAQKGDHYEEETFTPDSTIWSKRAPTGKPPKEQVEDTRQFDIITGEWLYEGEKLEEVPELLAEPAGADIESILAGAYRMLPNVARDLDHQAFGVERARATETSEGGYIPTPYFEDMSTEFKDKHDKDIADELSGIGDQDEYKPHRIKKKDGLTALRETAKFKAELNKNLCILDEEYHMLRYDTIIMQSTKVNLLREIFFLRRRVDEDRANLGYAAYAYIHTNIPPPGYKSQAPAATTPVSVDNGLGEKKDATHLQSRRYWGERSVNLSIPDNIPNRHANYGAPLSTPSGDDLRHFKAHMEEEVEAQIVAMNRKQATIAKLTPIYEDVCMEVEDLTAERDLILKSFGAKSIEDIPNFHCPIPYFNPLRMDPVEKKRLEHEQKLQAAREAAEGSKKSGSLDQEDYDAVQQGLEDFDLDAEKGVYQGLEDFDWDDDKSWFQGFDDLILEEEKGVYQELDDFILKWEKGGYQGFEDFDLDEERSVYQGSDHILDEKKAAFLGSEDFDVQSNGVHRGLDDFDRILKDEKGVNQGLEDFDIKSNGVHHGFGDLILEEEKAAFLGSEDFEVQSNGVHHGLDDFDRILEDEKGVNQGWEDFDVKSNGFQHGLDRLLEDEKNGVPQGLYHFVVKPDGPDQKDYAAVQQGFEDFERAEECSARTRHLR